MRHKVTPSLFFAYPDPRKSCIPFLFKNLKGTTSHKVSAYFPILDKEN